VGRELRVDDGTGGKPGKVGQRYWDIPGGFCEIDEHPSQTAIREAREETGLEIELTGLLGLWLDAYVENMTLIIYYLALPLTRRLQPGTDAEAAAWFAPDALPPRIAFASGFQALTTWAEGSVQPLHLRGTPFAAASQGG
jgi:ADP-ribose pyrophosphatase YjhB (NUDIX family)